MILPFRPEVRAPAVAAALVALGAAGCNQQTFTWVGPAWDNSGAESDAVAAITVQNGEVRAYVCGGATTFSTLSRWYDGEVGDSNSYQASADDGSSIQGGVADGYAWGAVQTAGGSSFYVDATSAEDDLAGLYAVEDSGCQTGVVVFTNTGGEPLLQGTWCDAAGNFAQVTPVNPIAVTERGIHVQVDLGPLGLGGVRDLYVTKDAVR